MSDLRDILGIEYPIIQAPMAGAQDSEMALAVCGAGGLGSLPCARFDETALREQLARLAERAAGPFNVNFFCHDEPRTDPERDSAWREMLAPYYREAGLDPSVIEVKAGRAPFSHEVADVVEPFRPPVVSFHFGLPEAALLERVKGWGSKVMSTATTVEEAVWLEQRGVDLIIAQGLEAGGHRGHFLSADLTRQAGTFALLPRVVEAVRVPVVAAGGIASAESVMAAMALGAVGAQAGTAFLLCPEATISDVHRTALRSEAAGHTAITNLFSGRPARGIVNRIMSELGPMNDRVPDFPLAVAGTLPIRKIAEAKGSGDFSSLWCGQNPDACREIPAGEMVRRLMPG